MFFEPQFETIPRPELEKLQYDRLKSTLELTNACVPFYARRFKELGFEPGDLKNLSDLTKLPFTDKEDLNRHFPEGFLACPPSQITRYHASSGTTGQVTIMGFTEADINTWARLMARCFSAAEVTSSDVVNVAYNYGLFTGGLGAHFGADLLGAAILPCSGGASHRQVELMRRLGVTVLCCTPSYALFLAEVAKEDGFDFRDKEVFPLRVGLLGAEPWSDSLKRVIEERLDIKALNLYGLSEVMGPGISIECLEGRNGLHIFEDHFLAEIIDPQTGEVLGPGREGELVLTTLTRQGVPLIRYRTRDITSLIAEPCSCGRTHLKMSRVIGRSDEMLVVRGINVYPSQFEELILSEKTLSPNYQINVDRENDLDTIEIQVEPNPDNFFPPNEETLKETLGTNIKERFGLTARIRVLPFKTVVRGQSKTQRVFDRRRGKF
jgi:phenylacetate-CoA ligase